MKQLLFAIISLLTLSLYSQTIYVSPLGSDNASGTSVADAWQTISKVNGATLAPGTHLLFEGGQNFNGGLVLDHADGNDASNPVVISSYGNGKAIINSSAGGGLYAYNTQGITISNLVFTGSGLASNTTDGILFYTDLGGDVKLGAININNVDISGYGKTGISLISNTGNTGYKNVVIDAAHVHHIKTNGIITSGVTSQSHTGYAHQNITISNTEVDNVSGYADPATHRGSGIILGQVDGGLIEKTAAHDNGAGNTHCGGPGGIWAWDCNNLIIQSCESYHNSSGIGCDGLGFDLDGGVTNSLMQYNYSHDNDGAGYLLGQYDYARPWANNVVRYNISENDGRTNAGGITLFKGAGTTMSGCKIYNNTVYETPSAKNAGVGGLTVIDWNKGINGVEVYNNIFQTTGGASLVNIPAGYDIVFTGNVYWSTGGAFKITYQGSTYSDLATWRTATGREQSGTTPTGLSANPGLSSAGYGGTMWPLPVMQLNAYKLAPGSPAIDAGLNLSALHAINPGTRDFFGDILFSGSAADIGAHESASGGGMTTGIAALNGVENAIFFPNPVNKGNPILVKGVTGKHSCELYAITGALVWKKADIESNLYEIPTYGLAAGVYIVRILDENEHKKTHKVIVE